MKVLVLSPHLDDAEISAGATIARFIEEGHSIFYVGFSLADVSLPKTYKKGHLKLECLKATEKLGIFQKNITFLNYETRQFPRDRQQILEDLYKIWSQLHPDLVLTPSSHDTHQDHQTICEESKRVFKTSSTIWGYENPLNSLHFTYDIFVEVSKTHLDKKIQSILQYDSQRKIRKYFSEDFVLSFAKTNGFRCALPYAECFELIREIRKL